MADEESTAIRKLAPKLSQKTWNIYSTVQELEKCGRDI